MAGVVSSEPRTTTYPGSSQVPPPVLGVLSGRGLRWLEVLDLATARKKAFWSSSSSSDAAVRMSSKTCPLRSRARHRAGPQVPMTKPRCPSLRHCS